MDFEEVVKDIKSLKIQGADNVALAGVLALIAKDKPEKIIKLRPTEPALRNLIKFVDKDPIKNAPIAIKYILDAKVKIGLNGAKLIKKNYKVFTHCHSSSVMSILREAKKEKTFQVFNTETRPMFQGRKTSEELSKLKIKSTQMVDSAAHIYLKDCNLLLLGADSIEGKEKVVYNKIGSYTLAQLAYRENIPIYHAASLLKFDYDRKTKLEFRSEKEVWNKSPKNVKIVNPAFDKVPFELIKGIVCEEGVLTPLKYTRKSKKLIKSLLKK